MSNAPSGSGGGLPQAIWPLRDSPNLDWIAPDNRHWPCLPLDWKCFCSPEILCANFPAVQTKIICKQSYVKNVKPMSVLKILKVHFFHKTSDCLENVMSTPYLP